MVQVSFDTKNDSLEDLQYALAVLQSAIERRGGEKPARAVAVEHPATQPTEQTIAVETEPVAAIVQEAETQLEQPVENAETPAEGEVVEETALDTPFLKITVKNADHEEAEQHKEHAHKAHVPHAASETEEVPTLNQLLSDQLSEDDLRKLYKEVIPEVENREKPAVKQKDPYIEIIEYEEK